MIKNQWVVNAAAAMLAVGAVAMPAYSKVAATNKLTPLQETHQMGLQIIPYLDFILPTLAFGGMLARFKFWPGNEQNSESEPRLPTQAELHAAAELSRIQQDAMHE
jgi:hypothetical protein